MIHVALVGLSAHSATSWAANAHLPYLLSERGRARFQIVALFNTSVEAARAAAAHFGLPDTTLFFGDATALADAVVRDRLIDLVVVSTRVDVHYSAILPTLQAAVAQGTLQQTPFKTGLLVEWPLAQDLAHVRELAALATQPGAPRTAVTLQGRLAPPYAAVGALLRAGRIGRVMGSEARGFGGTINRDVLPENLRYFADRSIGGNPYTISFGHLIDSLQFVLGEIIDAQPQFQLQRPNVPVRSADGTINKTVLSNVPDLFTVVGRLAPSDIVHANGATLLVRERRGPPFPGEPAFVWTVTGETGEIRLTAPSGPSVNASSDTDHGSGPGTVLIDVHDFATDTVTAVRWQESGQEGVAWPAGIAELPTPSRSVGLLYEAYAAGEEHKYATFADAAHRHEQLESWLATWKGK